MRRLRLVAASLAVALALAATVPGSAQQGPGPSERERVPGTRKSDPPKAEPKAAEPKPIPKSMRKPGATSVPDSPTVRAQLLDELYAHLATSTDEQVANRISNAIEHVWLHSGSDTVAVLMERAARATKEKKHQVAIKVLDRVVQLAPDYTEGFTRRALVHYANNDVERALGDLRRAVALDPNHYRALDGMGQILREIGQKKAALAVYRRLHEVHPYFSGAKGAIDELAREVEGQRL